MKTLVKLAAAIAFLLLTALAFEVHELSIISSAGRCAVRPARSVSRNSRWLEGAAFRKAG
jgi:hypothetical protein